MRKNVIEIYNKVAVFNYLTLTGTELLYLHVNRAQSCIMHELFLIRKNRKFRLDVRDNAGVMWTVETSEQ